MASVLGRNIHVITATINNVIICLITLYRLADKQVSNECHMLAKYLHLSVMSTYNARCDYRIPTYDPEPQSYRVTHDNDNSFMVLVPHEDDGHDH